MSSEDEEFEITNVKDLEMELFIPQNYGFHEDFYLLGIKELDENVLLGTDIYSVIYTGEMINNKPHGEGILCLGFDADGEPDTIYEGNFNDGLFNGKGILKSCVDTYHETLCRDGHDHGLGYGTKRIKIWRTYKTTWKNGIIEDGPCIFERYDGVDGDGSYKEYEGNIVDNKLHGKFIEILPEPRTMFFYKGKESNIRY
tara:strand:- start:9675 stop:10271 length:597 start_codon:yes stop_codon:yes gene_type:complete